MVRYCEIANSDKLGGARLCPPLRNHHCCRHILVVAAVVLRNRNNCSRIGVHGFDFLAAIPLKPFGESGPEKLRNPVKFGIDIILLGGNGGGLGGFRGTVFLLGENGELGIFQSARRRNWKQCLGFLLGLVGRVEFVQKFSFRFDFGDFQGYGWGRGGGGGVGSGSGGHR